MAAPDDAGTGVSSDSTSTSDADTSGPPPGTTAGDGVDSTAGTTDADTTDTADDTTADDAELCLQWCLNADARGCDPPFSGETCYTRCLDTIDWALEDGCADEQRDVLACEGQAAPPAEIYCESLECEDAYKRHDLCRGFCAHLGGIPGGGASQTTCDWRGTCYGHDFEVVCPVQDSAGLCTCEVDGQVIAQCEAGISLPAFECNEEIHVFTSCCAEVFEGVLLP